LILLPQDDKIRTVLAVSKKDFEDPAFTNQHFVLMASRKGLVKKTVLAAFSRPRVDGIIAIAVNEDDELLRAVLTDGKADVILASSEGLAIRFHETDVRATGRNTQGVRGMRLPKGRNLIGMVVKREGEEFDVLTISSKGAGKRTVLEDYPVQGRGGKGVLTQKTTDRTGSLVGIRGVTEGNDLMIITTNGIMIRLSVSGISRYGRNTQGVRLINLGDDDTIADVTLVATDDDEELDEIVEE
jgi:DNA gyrase subunit A